MLAFQSMGRQLRMEIDGASVTGCGSGLGEATSRALAKRGASVAVADQSLH
jgi:NADP-dependent 3-hydroxy acid dehydrogenase YdfG